MTSMKHNFVQRMNGLMRDESGNLFVLAAIGLLIIMGILALSVDHGRNYLNQADVEAKLTAQTKYAGREYIEWNIGQKIKELGYGSVTDKQDVLLKVGDSRSQALTKLRDFVSTQIFGSTTPQGACVGMPSISTNSAGQEQLDFYAKVVQVSNFVIKNGGRKNACNCSSGTATVEDQCTLVQSGVLLPFGFSPENADFAAQLVLSLDNSSKTKLGNQVSDIATKVDNVLKGLNSDNPKIYTGVQLGNIPSGVDKTGAAMPGLQLVGNNDMGWSGGAYDNSRDRDGTRTGPRNEDQSRKHPVKLSIDAQYTRGCSNPVWTYYNSEAGQCNDGISGIRLGTCESQYPADAFVNPHDHGLAVSPITTADGNCQYNMLVPMYQGHWVRACGRGANVFKSPQQVITGVKATFAAKNTPLGAWDFNTALAGVVVVDGVPSSSLGGGQASTEFGSKLYAKNTEKSWPHACDSQSPDASGAWGLPFGKDGLFAVFNAGGTAIDNSSGRNACNLSNFESAGFASTGFEFRNVPGYEDGNFPEGFYKAEMDLEGLSAAAPAGEPAVAEFSGRTPPQTSGWGHSSRVNASGTPNFGACPSANPAPFVKYLVGVSQEGGIPAERFNVASATAEYGTDQNGDIVVGVLDSFDFDINKATGVVHPRGSPPVVNNDNGDGQSHAFGGGATYPWFYQGASPSNLVEHRFLNDSANKPQGVLSVVGGDQGTQPILGWWPDDIVSCQEDGVETPPPSWCYSLVPFINLNTVKDFKVTYDAMNPNTSPGAEPGQIKAGVVKVSLKGAQNLPTTYGGNSYQNMLSELKRGYDGYGIYPGLDGNQCALLKAGLSQVKSVGVGNNNMRRGLVFVGGCPPSSWSNSSLDFKGQTVSSWFANGNIQPPDQTPGLLSPAPYLKDMNKPTDAGGGAFTSLIAQTENCFSQVKGQVDGFLVLTDASCPNLAGLSSDIELGTPTSPGCEAGVTPTADCIRRFILATVPLDGREVKKR